MSINYQETQKQLLIDKVISTAKSLEGTPYCWGGSNPTTGFDCSGFIIYIFQKNGILPNNYDASAHQLYQKYSTHCVNKSKPYKGCLKFIKNSSGHVYHVELFINSQETIGASGGTSDTCRNDPGAKVQIRNYIPKDNIEVCDPFGETNYQSKPTSQLQSPLQFMQSITQGTYTPGSLNIISANIEEYIYTPLPSNAYKEGATCIGDVWLTIPPVQITRQIVDGLANIPTIRTICDPVYYTSTSWSPYDLILSFAGDKSINNELRNIIAMSKFTPMVSICNTDMYQIEGKGKEHPATATDGKTTLNCFITGLTVETTDSPDKLNVHMTVEPVKHKYNYHRTTDSVTKEQLYKDTLRNFTDTILEYRGTDLGEESFSMLKDSNSYDTTPFTYNSHPFSKFYRSFIENPDKLAYPIRTTYPKLKQYNGKESPSIKLDYLGFSGSNFQRINDRLVEAYQNEAIAYSKLLLHINNMMAPIMKEGKDRRLEIVTSSEWIKALSANISDFLNKILVDDISVYTNKLYDILKSIPRIKSGHFSTILKLLNGLLTTYISDLINNPEDSSILSETVPIEQPERVYVNLGSFVRFIHTLGVDLPYTRITLEDFFVALKGVAEKSGYGLDFYLEFFAAFKSMIELISKQYGMGINSYLGLKEKTLDLKTDEKTVVNGMSVTLQPKVGKFQLITGEHHFQHMGISNTSGEISIETCDKELLNKIQTMSVQMKSITYATRKYGTILDNILYKMDIQDSNNFFGLFGVKKCKIQNVHIQSTDHPGWFRIIIYFIQDDLDLQKYEALSTTYKIPMSPVKILSGGIMLQAVRRVIGNSVDEMNKRLKKEGDPYRIIDDYTITYNGNQITYINEPWKSIIDNFVTYYKLTSKKSKFLNPKLIENSASVIEALENIAKPKSPLNILQVPFNIFGTIMAALGITPSTQSSNKYKSLTGDDLEKYNIILLIFKYMSSRELVGIIYSLMANSTFRSRLESPYIDKMFREDKYLNSLKKSRPYYDIQLPDLNGVVPDDPSFYIKSNSYYTPSFFENMIKEMDYRNKILWNAAIMRGYVTQNKYDELKKIFGKGNTSFLSSKSSNTIQKYHDEYLKRKKEFESERNYNPSTQLDSLDLTNTTLNELHLLYEAENKIEMATLLHMLKEAAVSDAKSIGTSNASNTANHTTEIDIISDTFNINFNVDFNVKEAIDKICSRTAQDGDMLLSNTAIGSITRKLIELAKGVNLVNLRNNSPEDVIKIVGTYWGTWGFTQQSKYTTLLRNVFEASKREISINSRIYPTFRIIFSEKDNKGLYLYDDYFSYYAISMIAINRARDRQAVAEIHAVDHFGFLSSENAPLDRESPFSLSEFEQTYKTRLSVRPGTRMLIYLGYGKTEDLPLLFQGTITDIGFDTENYQPITNIIAHGDGGELNQIIAPEGIMLGSTSTSEGVFARNLGDVATWILKQVKGLEYLGGGSLINFMATPDTERSGEFTSFLDVLTQATEAGVLSLITANTAVRKLIPNSFDVDDNIYLPYESSKNLMVSVFDRLTFDWGITAKTAWEALLELTTWRKNYILAVRPYNEELGTTMYSTRSTVYLGSKDGFYKATDLYSNESQELSNEFMTKLEQDVKSALGITSNSKPDAEALWELGLKYRGLIDYLIPGFKLMFEYVQDIEAPNVAWGLPKGISQNTYWETVLSTNSSPMTMPIGQMAILFGPESAYTMPTYPLTAKTIFERHRQFLNDTQLAWFNLYGNKSSKKYKKLRNKIEKMRRSKSFILSVALNDNDALARSRQYKPVRNTHIVLEDEIVQNGIKTSMSDNFANEVILQFGNEPFLWAPGIPARTPFIKKIMLQSASFDRVYKSNLDDDIPPELIVQKMVQSTNIDTNWVDEMSSAQIIKDMTTNKKLVPNNNNKYNTIKKDRKIGVKLFDVFPTYMQVAINTLGKFVSNFYTGELVIIGNPNIREYDLIYLWDNVTTMKGFFEVSSVTHQLTTNGYLTRIKPAMLTYVADMSASFDAAVMESIFTFSNKDRWIDGVIDTMKDVALGLTIASIPIPPITQIGGAVIGGARALYHGTLGNYIKHTARVIDRVGRLAGRQSIDILPMWKDEAPMTLGLDGMKKDTLEMHIRDFDSNGNFLDVIYDNAGIGAWVMDPDRQHKFLVGLLNSLPSPLSNPLHPSTLLGGWTTNSEYWDAIAEKYGSK